MSAICTFLAAMAVLLVSANAADPHAADHPPADPLPAHVDHPSHAPPVHDVCFKKVQKCCFKYAPCGFVTKKKPVTPRCDFKKCEEVCKPSCKLVPHKHPKKTCAYSKVHKGEDCGYFLTYKNHKPAETKKCFPVYAFEKGCYGAEDVVYKEVCTQVCAPICTLERAVCTKTDVYQYVKFCTKLGCSAVKTEGDTGAPPSYVGKETKLVKKIPGEREILAVEPVGH